MSLKPLQIAFIDAYFACGFNATEAMIRVKPDLARSSASCQGSMMVREAVVREEIERKLAAWRAQHRFTVEEIKDHLSDSMRVEVMDFYDENGNLLPFHEMPPHARAQIKSVTTEENILGYATKKKLELYDKTKQMELLGKALKMFSEKLEVDLNVKKINSIIDLGAGTGEGE
jgi:phage terminase small subunit